MENLIESPWNTTDERLRKTFSAALIFHVVLLLVSALLSPPDLPPPRRWKSHWLITRLTRHRKRQILSLKPISLAVAIKTQASQPTTAQLSPFEGRDQGQLPVPEQERLQADSQTILASAGDTANPPRQIMIWPTINLPSNRR